MPLKLIISNQVIFWPYFLLRCLVMSTVAMHDGAATSEAPLPPLPPQGNCCPATVTPDTLTGVSKQS